MLITPTEVSKLIQERQDAMNKKTDIVAERVKLAKNAKVGQVVYFLEGVAINGIRKNIISFGVVESIFHDGLNIKRYYPFKKRIVKILDDRLKDEYKTEDIAYHTRWYKLPKGYSKDPVDCRLMEISYTKEMDEKNENLKNVILSQPESILQAIQEGILVKGENIDDRNFEVEIEKQEGFRVVAKNKGMYESKYDVATTFFRFSEIYISYEAAKEEITREEQELKRESALSDEDWSKEQIVDTALFWRCARSRTEEECAKVISFLFEQPNIEDLEVKIDSFTFGLDYKYGKNKRWVHIDLEHI